METVGGRPVRFANEQIMVQDLKITAALMKPDQFEAPWAWTLVAELRAKGRFDVTVNDAT